MTCSARRSVGSRHGARRRGRRPWCEETRSRLVSVQHDEVGRRGSAGQTDSRQQWEVRLVEVEPSEAAARGD